MKELKEMSFSELKILKNQIDAELDVRRQENIEQNALLLKRAVRVLLSGVGDGDLQYYEESENAGVYAPPRAYVQRNGIKNVRFAFAGEKRILVKLYGSTLLPERIEIDNEVYTVDVRESRHYLYCPAEL